MYGKAYFYKCAYVVYYISVNTAHMFRSVMFIFLYTEFGSFKQLSGDALCLRELVFPKAQRTDQRYSLYLYIINMIVMAFPPVPPSDYIYVHN